MPNSLELMTEKFEMLPEVAKEAIRLFDYDKYMKEIHKKHHLHIDQSYALEQAIAMVIFGEIRPQSLIEKIKEELRFDEEKAKEIAFDVNSMILIPIQGIMKHMQTEDSAV
jgi:hypothetical protein